MHSSNADTTGIVSRVNACICDSRAHVIMSFDQLWWITFYDVKIGFFVSSFIWSECAQLYKLTSTLFIMLFVIALLRYPSLLRGSFCVLCAIERQISNPMDVHKRNSYFCMHVLLLGNVFIYKECWRGKYPYPHMPLCTRGSKMLNGESLKVFI